MKNGYKVIRLLYPNDVRKLCIEKKWYTKGTIEEYDNLIVDFIGNLNNITSDEIVEIAENIKEHSETEYELTSIMYELARICESFFENAKIGKIEEI